MEFVLKPAQDLLVIVTILLAIAGPGMVVILFSIKNTASREEWAEIVATGQYALWDILWTLRQVFAGTEKRLTAWIVSIVTGTALLAVTTHQLNSGTWNFSGIALGAFVLLVLLAAAVFIYCVRQENKESLHQRY